MFLVGIVQKGTWRVHYKISSTMSLDLALEIKGNTDVIKVICKNRLLMKNLKSFVRLELGLGLGLELG